MYLFAQYCLKYTINGVKLRDPRCTDPFDSESNGVERALMTHRYAVNQLEIIYK